MITYEITEPQRGVITDVLPRIGIFAHAAASAPSDRAGDRGECRSGIGGLCRHYSAAQQSDAGSLSAWRGCPAAGNDRLNKIDEAAGTQADELIARYRRIGYSVYAVSAHSGAGLEALKAQLHNKLTVLVEPSGVGKSSLLNAWWPQLERGDRRGK